LQFVLEVSAIYAKCGEHSSFLDQKVQAGEYREVVDYVVPTGTTLEDFRGARQIQALLSKQTFVSLGCDPLLEGVKAFIKAERKCQLTNLSYGLGASKAVKQVLYLASRKISQILGPVPELASLQLRYGPGANTSVRMAEASLSGKLSATLACSEDMLPFVGGLLAEVPLLVEHWSERSSTQLPLWEPDPDFVRARLKVRVDDGKLVFVPKSAKTHRPIIVEPVLNGLFQLGVGSYLKDRLRTSGLDLRTQDLNRRLARKGSTDGSLATLDLSSASDTIALSVVADLLPLPWFEFLSQFRTGTFSYDGLSFELEKFSSMGNGFTFELESLIFWALCFGATRSVGGDVSTIGTYGDDLIVPVCAVDLLMETLDACGFWVNPSKSFWSGPFRESCGADWLDGSDVRPYYLRDLISDRVLFVAHNWAMRRCEREFASLCHAWTWPHNRLYGPDGYGDGHLIGSHDLYTTRESRRAGWGGGFFDTYSLGVKRTKIRRPSDWLLPAYSVYARTGAESPTDPFVTRGSVGYTRTPVYTHASTIFCR
jgi:hypothetical protein